MSKVRLLDRSLYELIAAGEVIERPSSIIKELVENSIDSGASAVTVEIKRGGISYMRVTDNGSGIEPDDVATAFLRHATSKISKPEDLSGIHTLGFRGEALASVAAVAKVDVLTKTHEADYGTHYIIEGTEEKLNEQCGCPDGTTIVVRDIFYNVPARLKFLKKDVAEGNDISRIMEKIALSHPEISVKLIRDNRQTLFTPGDSKLYSAVYSVFGRQFAASLIPVDYSMNGIKVSGYTVKPIFGVKNRKLQTFFVNGRYVQTLTGIRALEEAYKNSIMEGKFPACVLMLEVNPASVDVNVHPQKIEVRFTEERTVYEAVYFAVKNAILSDSQPNDIQLPKPKINYNAPVFGDSNKYEQTSFAESRPEPSKVSVKTDNVQNRVSAAEYRKIAGLDKPEKQPDVIRNGYVELPWEKIPVKPPVKQNAQPIKSAADTETNAPQIAAAENISEENHIAAEEKLPAAEQVTSQPAALAKEEDFEGFSQSAIPVQAERSDIPEEGLPIEQLVPAEEKHDFKYISQSSFEKKQEEPVPTPEPKYEREPVYRLIGEAFKTYIIAEMDDDIIFVDKHAAHERINFERMRSGEVKLCCQMMIEPAEIRLSYSQYDAVCENIGMIKELGFDIEPAETPNIRVRGIPSVLDVCDASDIAFELAKNLDESRHNPMPDILDDMLHTIACKASIRANDINTADELKAIVTRIFRDETIRYCPHGRPVMFKLKKRELEKQFRRIV